RESRPSAPRPRPRAPTRARPATGSRRRGRPAPSGTIASPDTDPSPPRRTGSGSSGLHREESRRPLQDVPLLTQDLVLPPQPPQLLALLGRQSVALARVHRRLRDPAAHRRLTEIELATDRRQRPLAPAHQGDDLSLELRRERPALPSACPVPLRLLPHSDSLHVGSRP